MKHSLVLASFLGSLALLPATVLAQSNPPSATDPSAPVIISATDSYGATVIGAAPIIPQDADGDGRVSRSEFTMGPILARQQEKDADKTEKEKTDLNLRERTNTVELFNDLDKDGDGFLSASELASPKANSLKR